MNPYEVLDVSPTMTLQEVNVRYRELMLLHHPDLHASEGPEAVKRAEAETRELNEAMAMMRRQHPPEGVRIGNDGSSVATAGGSAFADAAGSVSFAWERPTDRPMACPLCGNVFPGVADVEEHILDVHHIDLYAPPKAAKRRRRILTRRERRAIRTGLLLASFAAFVVIGLATGSLDRLSRGQFDPVIPIIVVLWGVVLARIVLKRQ